MNQQSSQPPLGVELAPHQRRIEKPWGWELIWAESNFYTGKLLHINAGCRISLQYHEQKVETLCLLTGCAILIAQDGDGRLQEIPMQTGNGYTIQPHQVHRLVAIEDAEIVEVSTPERGMTVRLEDDYRRLDETEAMRSLENRGWSSDGSSTPGRAETLNPRMSA